MIGRVMLVKPEHLYQWREQISLLAKYILVLKVQNFKLDFEK